MWYVVSGVAIILGMLVSGDRVAALLGRLLRPREQLPAGRPETVQTTT
jgi:hypothetical protein